MHCSKQAAKAGVLVLAAACSPQGDLRGSAHISLGAPRVSQAQTVPIEDLEVSLRINQDGTDTGPFTAQPNSDGDAELAFDVRGGVSASFTLEITRPVDAEILEARVEKTLTASDRVVTFTKDNVEGTLPDADDDGVADLIEIVAGTDPDDPTDTPSLLLSISPTVITRGIPATLSVVAIDFQDNDVATDGAQVSWTADSTSSSQPTLNLTYGGADSFTPVRVTVTHATGRGATVVLLPVQDSGCSGCAGGTVCCNGGCVDLAESNVHCGRCGASCSDCTAGHCIDEVCDNSIDDDGNLYIDCADPSCLGNADCLESCFDGIDNDGDTFIDCDDLSCRNSPCITGSQYCCDGLCRDLQTDPNYCGGCDPVTPCTGECSGGNCTAAGTCQDGTRDPGEQCDDSDAEDEDGCTSECRINRCGDSFHNIGVEDCDDGNLDASDGCTPLCLASEASPCGDCWTNPATETCDDGNQLWGDGCDQFCQLENDRDGDGLADAAELRQNLDPSRDADKDGDGLLDREEWGPNGCTPRDTDEDGNPDMRDADSDTDGHGMDGQDSCPRDVNNEEDADGDGIDDACDPCPLCAHCAAPGCTIDTCTAGWSGCGTSNCDVALNTASHCGSCVSTCDGHPSASASCSTGTCLLTCNSGVFDCDDNTANGCESPGACDDGNPCRDDLGCASGFCARRGALLGECAPATCDNGVVDGGESGVDCGGGGCADCRRGQACVNDANCESPLLCNGLYRCDVPPCADDSQSGTERDVDCGGGCLGCVDGRPCGDPDECLSQICEDPGGGFQCAAGNCDDGARNQGELGVDCGGPCYRACRSGEGCAVDAECAGLSCLAGLNLCAYHDGLALQGALCQGDDDQCASSHCVDGYCCSAACDSTCTACNLPDSEGDCGDIPDGQDPDSECTGGAGVCNGLGGCH